MYKVRAELNRSNNYYMALNYYDSKYLKEPKDLYSLPWENIQYVDTKEEEEEKKKILENWDSLKKDIKIEGGKPIEEMFDLH